ncbi:MAG: NRDE family protein [Bacteroidota bacterium]
MCTVSYLPKSNGSFILTSNRDEAPSRATHKVVEQSLENGIRLLFPQDPQSGGTWIALSDTGRLICLLNGAFEQHRRQPPYRRSRGLLVLDVFEYASLETFFQSYELDGIEPFTMVIVEEGMLYEFRWDGEQSYLEQLEAQQAHIWSSATLYDATYRLKRKALFDQWLMRQPDYEVESILDFHRGGGTGDPDNDFVMNRQNIVRTVSITSVEKTIENFHFLHRDLLSEHEVRHQFEIHNAETVSTN